MGQERVQIDKDRLTAIIAAILNPPISQEQLLPVEVEAPEKRLIELLRQQSPDPFVQNALFMTSTMVFADNTYRSLGRITNEYLLNRYTWIFKPDKVIEAVDQGVDVKAKCFEFFRPGGYNGTALSQWVHNCRVLNDKYAGDIRNFFKENGNDAIRIVNSLVVSPRAKTDEKPGLRRAGPKIARLYIQWVGQYGLYDLQNIDQFGLPVDFQIGRLAIQTGAVVIDSPLGVDLITRRILLPLISDICQENGFDPRKVSEEMWLVGNRYCNQRRHSCCPVEDLCTSMISRRPYDKSGLFDPEDVGRYTQ